MKYYDDDRPRSPEEKYGAFFDAYDTDRMEVARRARAIQEQADRQSRDRAERRRKKRWRAYRRRAAAVLILLALIAGLIFGIRACASARGGDPPAGETTSEAPVEAPVEAAAPAVLAPVFSDQTAVPGEDVYSPNAILVDAESGAVLASKNGDADVKPASLVKLMTALVAAESLTDVKETYTFPYEVLAPLYQDGEAVMIGYFEGETATLDELFHGALMFSGADAAAALAARTAGSQEAFVAKMNEKAAALGMTSTVFADPVGLNDDATTTCRDLAVLMKAVLDNEYLRRVVSTEDYTLPPTSFHPDGIKLKHSMFAKMVGNEPGVAVIRGGKTGFTGQAGFCLASYATTHDGRTLIAVTTGANGNYRPVYDAFTLYRDYSGAVSKK